jgi:decaprenylphospho-beta-D-erythro-pentofuranosid-2-ulose 2-reductase
VVLAVRDLQAAEPVAASLRRAGADTVDLVAFDAHDIDGHEALMADVYERFGDIDLVLLAFGVLGEQVDFDADPAAAARAAEANYGGAVSCGLAVAQQIRRQGHGTLVVLSSVAAIRARRSNFVYGSTKAGLDAFAQGLGDHLLDAGGRVMVVRPGPVRTRMTAGMPEQPFTSDAAQVADCIVEGLQKNREIVYAPALLRWVFAVMRALPRPLWRIISAR